jgi:hypothetical protein
MRSIIPINFYKVEYFKSMLTYYVEGMPDHNFTKGYIDKHGSKIITHTIYGSVDYRNKAGRYSYV